MAEIVNVTNPYNNALVDTVPVLGTKELLQALKAAKAAKEVWRNTSVYERSHYIRRFLKLAEAHGEELAQTLSAEMGKPVTQARAELNSVSVISESFVQKANHLCGQVLNADNQPGYEKDLIFTRREPLGVIACIIPFNYPVKLFIHKVIPALIMGNVVLAKAPRENPLTIMKLGELFEQAGFPKGVIRCFVCSREDSTRYLIENKDVQAVSLTGSTRAGIQMVEASAKSMKHMFMELGGNDGTIIRADADIDFAAEEIAKTVEQGARLVCGGKRRGAVIEPTILSDVTRDMDIAGDMEVFGPVVPVIGFDTDEEALSIINQSCYGLSSGIITKDIQTALRMAAEIEAGATVLNGQGNYRHTEQGFGGVKMTGFSREGVSATLEEFSRVKHFVLRNAF